MLPEQINLALFYIAVLPFELWLCHMEPDLQNFFHNLYVGMYGVVYM
jgi:hypothetical protein